MLLLLVLLAVFALTNAAVLPEARIVGGTLATIEEAPWQVALLNDYRGDGTFQQACGGAIISRTVVISSALAIFHLQNPQLWRVRAGSADHSSGGEVFSVTSFKIHELLNLKYLDNDIVIVRLNGQITLGATAATITLPVQGATILDGVNCILTGWGALEMGGEYPTQLYKVTVPVVNQDQCISAYSEIGDITNNMLCAGRMGVGGVDACYGDNGSPLTSNGILIGLNSWGRDCGEPEYPGVYTRVSMYRTWISNNL